MMQYIEVPGTDKNKTDISYRKVCSNIGRSCIVVSTPTFGSKWYYFYIVKENYNIFSF